MKKDALPASAEDSSLVSKLQAQLSAANVFVANAKVNEAAHHNLGKVTEATIEACAKAAPSASATEEEKARFREEMRQLYGQYTKQSQTLTEVNSLGFAGTMTVIAGTVGLVFLGQRLFVSAEKKS